MISVRGGSSRTRPGKITGSDGISRGATDTDHLFNTINYLAWPHITVLTACSLRTEKTCRNAAGLDPIVGSYHTFGYILRENFLGGLTGYICTAFTSVSFNSHFVPQLISSLSDVLTACCGTTA
jgi:hypothetical protein